MATVPSTPVRERVWRWLHGPEDAASLAIFRVIFGAVMVWDITRYLLADWPRTYFFVERFLFKYEGFGWVHPLPPLGMWFVFIGTLACAAAVMLGLVYRVAAVGLCVGHSYIFLLSASHYLNHAYLICLLTFLMIWLPAHHALSFDAWLGLGPMRRTVPRWPRALLVAQVGLVYFYGGIAKLNTDWLVYRMPIRRWLLSSARDDPSEAGIQPADLPWGSELVGSEFAAYLVPWGGCAFDLVIAPALLWKRTRAYAVVLVLMFHLSNHVMFDIGVFPLLMSLATPIFFEADWARRVPLIGPWVGSLVDRGSAAPSAAPHRRAAIEIGLSVWLAVQLLMPLRHHLYPGWVAWNEAGHKYAWRMKLRSKRGAISYRVVDPQTGEQWRFAPIRELTSRQVRKMAGRPTFIVQYAHHLDARFRREKGIADPEVYVDVMTSLNYRNRVRFIDPRVDLSNERVRVFTSYPFVLPFPGGPPPVPEVLRPKDTPR